MPIGKRKGIWFARVQVGGFRIERTLGPGSTREEAKELEAALRKRLRDDRHAKRVGKSLNRTFGEALLHYMKQPETKNLKSYQSLKSVANLVRPYLQNFALEETPERAEEMKQALIAEGLTNGTINRRLALVRRILRKSYKPWNWLMAPLTVSLLPEDNERQLYPPVNLAYEFAETISNRPVIRKHGHVNHKDIADATLVAYFTGMRRGELMRVNRDPEKYIEKNFIKLYSGNKTKKPGRIPIAPAIRCIIARMPLKITPRSIQRDFQYAREKLGCPELQFRDFRHGFASLVAESGAEAHDLMKLMRHTSFQTTKRYLHLLDGHLEGVISKADKLAASKTA